MANLYVMVGLPGAGKSYKAAQISKAISLTKSAVRIASSDAIRERLFGDANDQSHNKAVFNTLYSDVRNWLREGNSVIIDSTNTTLKARKQVFAGVAEVKEYIDKVIAVVVAPPIEKVIAQDRQRERRVGEEVINKFLYSFQFPQKFEGFDEIWLNDYTEESIMGWNKPLNLDVNERMEHFDQQNKHHLYTVGDHCAETYGEVFAHISDIPDNDHRYYWFVNMLFAARFHDVGKLFTQTIDENGQAHYNNHDSVGTYFLVSHADIIRGVEEKSEWDDLYEVLFFVNYHMRAHRDFCGEKAEKKYRKIFGDERFDMLMLFAECDRLASGTYKGKED